MFHCTFQVEVLTGFFINVKFFKICFLLKEIKATKYLKVLLGWIYINQS